MAYDVALFSGGPMPDDGQEIKRGRKFDQVLEGAREVFLRDGFDGASVDDIARAAGVSKATLYSYFPDKRLLFMEVARSECQAQADMATAQIDPRLPIRDVLLVAGEQMIAIMSQTFNQRMYRMCVAESERFPEIGRQFYECGPGLVRDRIAFFLRKYVEKGDLVIVDFDLAAEQFALLCKVDLMDRCLFKLETTYSNAEITRVVEGAVDMFLARYGRRA